MNSKFVLALGLVFVLFGVLGLSFSVHEVKAPYPTVYIRADGSIDPPTANITSLDNVTYTFTADINASIAIEKNNTVVDGAGYTLQGVGGGTGIGLSYTNNVTLQNVKVTNFTNGIYLYHSSNNTVSGNPASNNFYYGIFLDSSNNNTLSGNTASSNNGNGISLYDFSNNNTVSGNTASNNQYGISLFLSNDNTLTGNTASTNQHGGIRLLASSDNTLTGNTASSNSGVGIILYSSSNNVLFHNNLIDNANNVETSPANPNVLDNSVEGNYWSNYTGVDLNHDGIGDTPHVINDNNTDNYPLMGMFHSCDVWWIYPGFTVTLVSNSTVSNFNVGIDIEPPGNRVIMFDATGEIGFGFCRLCISKDLMAPPYIVVIDNGETTVLYYNETVFDNSTHRWIYFAYQHSEHQVIIIPEFPAFLVLPLFMMATLLAALVFGRKQA